MKVTERLNMRERRVIKISPIKTRLQMKNFNWVRYSVPFKEYKIRVIMCPRSDGKIIRNAHKIESIAVRNAYLINVFPYFFLDD